MKKLLTLVIAGGMLAFYACGPSKAQLEAKEKATQDSIHLADSLAAAQVAAEEAAKAAEAAAQAAAQAEQAKMDSIRVADSLAAAKKGGSKVKPKTVAPKAGQGKG
jgi:carbonic anhydrase